MPPPLLIVLALFVLASINDEPLYIRIGAYAAATASIIGALVLGWNRVVGPFIAKPLARVFTAEMSQFVDARLDMMRNDVNELKTSVGTIARELSEEHSTSMKAQLTKTLTRLDRHDAVLEVLVERDPTLPKLFD